MDFYKEMTLYYVNGVHVYSDSSVILAPEMPKDAMVDATDSASFIFRKIFGWEFYESKKGNYWLESYSQHVDIPVSLAEPYQFWIHFLEGELNRFYERNLRSVSVEYLYEPCEAPALNKLGKYKIDDVIEYLKERGIGEVQL